MAILNATLIGVNRTADKIQIKVEYTKISDSTTVATRMFDYDSTVVGSTILADVRTVGSTYIDALTKESNLNSIVGTTIQI